MSCCSYESCSSLPFRKNVNLVNVFLLQEVNVLLLFATRHLFISWKPHDIK